MKTLSRVAVACVLFVPSVALPAEPAKAPPSSAASSARPAWVGKSDANARLLLDVMARFSPEFAAELGLEGYDEAIVDMTPGFEERSEKATRDAVAELKKRVDSESEPAVKQDLQILIDAAELSLEGRALSRKYEVPYTNVGRIVFFGVQGLADDQVAPARRQAAVVRLRKYAGLEKGYRPLAELARERTRTKLSEAALLGPAKAKLKKDLAQTAFFVDGIADLMKKYQLKGWESALDALKGQLKSYDEFLGAEVLPRARDDFRLPPEMYAFALKNVGVEMAPEALAERAHVAYEEIRNEMAALAPLVAKEKGFPATDYKSVIKELKKSQLVGEAILPHYQKRMKDLEAIIQKEAVVTLPKREARIRLGSEAESAAQPAPHMNSPRLIGNTGEKGEFILPMNIPAPASADGKPATTRMDDFTHEAASWTLTAHEGRPGHELQDSAMIERGVSLARAVFAFNSVNVEGWALYAESEMKPYMPLDGQLIGLQHRLMRAARAFLDPELQMGKITPDAAKRILMEEVVLSEPMARQEVERYMFRMPGQATSYFYGYTKWLGLKATAEMALGPAFDRRRFHDFALAQGLLPPVLLAKAVTEEFIPAERKSAAGGGVVAR